MVGQFVDVTGTSVGKGFAGGMKRWNFGGLRATHGVSVSHRSIGSTGGRQDPGKTFKNKKMPGHMGVDRITTLNLRVVQTDVARGLILVEGAVPGSKGGWIAVRDAVKKPLHEGRTEARQVQGRKRRWRGRQSRAGSCASLWKLLRRKEREMKLNVTTLEGKDAGSVELSDAIFGLEPRKSISSSAASTGNSPSVSAGTHKTQGPRRCLAHRQKDVQAEGHRRRASRLCTRSAVSRRWPCVRSGRSLSHAFDLPKKVRALALQVMRCRRKPKTAA